MNDLDFSVYIQVSRGTYPTRSHAIAKQLETTEVAFCMPLRKVDLSQTHRAILREDTRHQHCHIKSTNLFANTQLQQIAQDNNAIECILHQGTRVTEGTSSNVFIVKKQKILTPSLEHNILRGITRDKIISLAKRASIPCIETTITVDELLSADEVWITSSSKGACPISIIDNNVIGNGLPGPIWRKINGLYSNMTQPRRAHQ